MKAEDVMKMLSWIDVASKNMGSVTLSRDEVRGILALLREKDGEIERLTEENDGWEATNKILTTNNADLEAELALTYDLLEESKSDTVMKMQERLKAKAKAHYFDNFDYAVSVENIDQIAKEMLEANE
jgi:hypothetical protein